MAEGSGRIGGEDLERELKRVVASATSAEAGLFGPESLTWRVDREAALFLGAGRALLLQLAHPWVAAGITQHSTTLTNPIGRFHRTFEIMFTLVFGDLDQAVGAARRLHRGHSAIMGRLPTTAGRFEKRTPYCANDAAALMWVHATLTETALIAHDLILPPLTVEERERYYQEARLLGAVFGLSVEEQPPNWEAFAGYNERMWRSETIAVSPEARQIAERIFSGAGTLLRPPSWYRAVTTHLLPEVLRAGFCLRYGVEERRTAERALAWIGRAYPALPSRLRYVGPYQEAVGRLSGRAGPGPLVRGLNRLWIGKSAMIVPNHASRRGERSLD